MKIWREKNLPIKLLETLSKPTDWSQSATWSIVHSSILFVVEVEGISVADNDVDVGIGWCVAVAIDTEAGAADVLWIEDDGGDKEGGGGGDPAGGGGCGCWCINATDGVVLGIVFVFVLAVMVLDVVVTLVLFVAEDVLGVIRFVETWVIALSISSSSVLLPDDECAGLSAGVVDGPGLTCVV